jgi:hypothetical protein
MQPWPSPRAGCASVKRLRRGLKSNAVFAPFARNRVCLFGWKPLDARRGAPKQRRRQAGLRLRRQARDGLVVTFVPKVPI